MSRPNTEPTLNFAYDNNGFNNSDVTMRSGGDRPFLRGIVRRGAHRQLGPVARYLIPGSMMLIELFERMVYFSVVPGIVFSAVLNWNFNVMTNAINLLGAFSGGIYLCAPIGGMIADAFLGRFYTILASTILYIAGLAAFVMASFDSSTVNMEEFDLGTRLSLGMIGIAVILIAGGGFKANIPPFGADQIRPLGERVVSFYFHWYYFFINVGGLLASLAITHLTTPKYLGAGLLVPLCGMAVSLLVFAGMYSQYVNFKPEREMIIGTCGIVRQGCCKGTPEPNNKLPAGTEKTLFANAMESYGGDKPDHVVSGFASFLKTALIPIILCGGWMGISLFYVTVPFQSEHMDRRVGSSYIPPWVTRSFFNISLLFGIFCVAFGVLPLFRRLSINLTPLRRIGIGLVLVIIGLIVTASVEVARKDAISDGEFSMHNTPPPQASKAFLKYMVSEKANKTREAFIAQGMKSPNFTMAQLPSLIQLSNQMVTVGLLLDTPDGFPLWELAQPWKVANISVLAQIPQFILMGTGEAFSAVAALELAYNQAPYAYQGLLTGIVVMAFGMGSLSASSLVLFIDGWTETCNQIGVCAGTWFNSKKDINDVHMDYLLFTGAGIVAFFFLIFTFIAYRHRYSDPMSFGELEEPEVPGIEMKISTAGDIDMSSSNYKV